MKNLKTNSKNKIKAVAVGVCMLLIATSFSSVLAAQERSTEYETYKQQTSNESYDFEDEFLDNTINRSRYDDIDSILPHRKRRDKNLNSWESEYSAVAPDFVPGEFIVKFKSNVEIAPIFEKDIVTTGIPSLNKLNKKHNIFAMENVFKTGKKRDYPTALSNVYKLSIHEDSDIPLVVKDYENDPNVEYAEPNYIYRTYVVPDDTYFDQQWALHNTGQTGGTPNADIDAPEAWDITTGSHDVVVAVIDTGVDYTHEDIQGNMWINEDEILDGNDTDGDGFIDNIYGADFAYDDGDPMDGHGHGTHCAGTIAAVGNNGIGVVGVNWQAKIMAVKGLDDDGYGNLGALAYGIVWAADQGADVISNSWGTVGRYPSDPVIEAAVQYAYDQGCVIVFAAGNDNDDVQYYCPANMDETIAVAATDHNDERAGFSNWGEKIDVCAPGVDILSLRANGTYIGGTVGDNYCVASGTSMACPHVAGLAALLLSKNQSLTPDMVKTIIVNTVDKVNSSVYIGRGRINAFEALKRSPALAYLDPFSDWTDIKGTIDINGTAWGEHFQYYVVEYGKGRDPDLWTELTNSTLPQQGVLTSWDTTEVADGMYTVQLRVRCSDGIYQDSIPVVVNNEYNLVIVDDDNTEGPWNGTEEYPFQHIQDGVDDAGHCDTVYVFNGTYLGGFVIERSIELLGENKHNTVISQAYLDGIYVTADHVQISGFTVRDNQWGILLAPLSKNCVVSGNIITENQFGIRVLFSSYNNITDNEIIDNLLGIYFDASSYNTVSKNTVRNSEDSAFSGVFIRDSLNNAVIDNSLMSTGIQLWSILLHPDSMIFWNTHTIENNVLNGKPIRYYKNMSDFVVPNNTAQVILANCTKVTIQNLSFFDTNGPVIQIGYSSHITISRNTILNNNDIGIILYMSSNCTINENSIIGVGTGIWVASWKIYGENIISNNIITNCSDLGIFGIYLLPYASNDKSLLISKNIIKSCSTIGVYISYGQYTTISGNDIIDCGEGLVYTFSDNNLVTDNNIRGNINGRGILLGYYSNNNTISRNVIINNEYGIDLSILCDNNTVQGNTLFKNIIGIFIYASQCNTIYHNNVIDSTYYNALEYSKPNTNIWYNATLKQGNRWDDYAGIDEDGDGIGDTPYNISGGVSQDLYPLMRPYGRSVINIDTGKVFSSIQQSIDDATTLDGHTIYVCPGIFYEDLVVNKAITLKGEKKEGTIIDGNGSGDVVHMVADGVNMNGFTIQHSGLTHVGINISSNSNIISDNNITDNNVGVKILSSYLDNIISHNNFVNNTLNACDYSTNAWDEGYPRGGNYWSDYTGEDTYYGPDQNIPGSDGVGDTPYNISGGVNQDRYPLVNPWNGTLPPVPPPNTVYVDDDYNLSTPGWGYDHFDNIEDSIDAVAEHGTIIVKPGTYQGSYHGTSILVDKTVNIIGENKDTTIIDGDGGEFAAVLVRNADNVTISGFTIKNSVVGIEVASDNISISNTIITENNYGLILSNSSNSMIYHNNFINNGLSNAKDYGDNQWDNGYPSGGNYWDDHDHTDVFCGPNQDESCPEGDGICDTPYNISGGDNQDRYPLMCPYGHHPLPDLIISNLSSEYLSETSTHISADYVSRQTMKLTATIKNIGEGDANIPFQVSFYGIDTDPSPQTTNPLIGTVTIPSLGAGESAEATIKCEIQPEIDTISVFADSTRVIEESNETNNKASITLNSSILWNSLMKTLDLYRQLSGQYETSSAKEVVMLAREAISTGVYTNPEKYVNVMKEIAELEYKVSKELDGQIPPKLLKEYQRVVLELQVLIKKVMDDQIITWEAAVSVAEAQMSVCKVVMEILKIRMKSLLPVYD